MKRIILLSILYVLGVLFIYDLSNFALFPEEYMNSFGYVLFTPVLISYFFVYLFVILGLNHYLLKINNKENYIWVNLLNILFLPVFMSAVFEYSFSFIGIVEYSQTTFPLLARAGLLMLIIGLLLFSLGYFKNINERDKRINSYIYLFFNLTSIVVLFFGLLFFQ